MPGDQNLTPQQFVRGSLERGECSGYSVVDLSSLHTSYKVRFSAMKGQEAMFSQF